jgi:hypothetical protein
VVNKKGRKINDLYQASHRSNTGSFLLLHSTAKGNSVNIDILSL